MKIISRRVSRIMILCSSLILPLKNGSAVEAARFFESTDYGLAFQLPPDVKATEHSHYGDFSAPVGSVPGFGISLDAPCKPDEARAWPAGSECMHRIGTIYIYPSVIEKIVPHQAEAIIRSTIETKGGINFVRDEEAQCGAGQRWYEVHYRTYKNRYCYDFEYDFEARTGNDFKVNELFNRVLETVKLSTPTLYSMFQPIDFHNPSVSGVVGTGAWWENQAIKIKLSNGQSLEFSAEENVKYSYGGFFSGFHIIKRVFPIRNQELFLIHQETGGKTTLTTYPIVSPDRTRIITLYPNSLVIWQITGSTIRVECQFQYQDEVPTEVRWKDGNTFLFWIRPFEHSDKGGLHIATMKESAWKESSITDESKH